MQIAGADGPVHAWYAAIARIGNVSDDPAIVFAHGNGERAEDWLDQFRDLQDAGIDVLIVEYPGYGIAEGSPTQTSITNAIVAGYDWLRDQKAVGRERIVAYGRSLGGGAAAQLAARRPVAALILESSFTSVRAFAGRFFAPGFLVRDPFDTLAVLAQYRAPLLVLHGTRDAIAPARTVTRSPPRCPARRSSRCPAATMTAPARGPPSWLSCPATRFWPIIAPPLDPDAT